MNSELAVQCPNCITIVVAINGAEGYGLMQI